MRRFILFCFAGLLLASCSSTIYIVRHAEKAAPTAGTGSDVHLSPAGLQRAQTLRDSLVGKNITHVYNTHFRRTFQTGGPTRLHFGLDTLYYNNGDSLLTELIKRQNKRTLVVGHSNTVPQMLRHIGLPPSFAGDIPDNDYDNLFIIKLSWFLSRSMRLAETTYGVTTP